MKLPKDIERSLNYIIGKAESIQCIGTDHRKGQYHLIGERCKVEAEIENQAEILRSYFAWEGGE